MNIIRYKHLVASDDLFCNFDLTKLTGKGNIKRIYKCADKNTLAKQIFLRYLHILFTDFMQGGKVFILPNRSYMELRMRRIPHTQFINARKNGKYADVDIIMSQQLCYEPVLAYKVRGAFYETPVKVSSNFREILVEKVNTGFKFC